MLSKEMIFAQLREREKQKLMMLKIYIDYITLAQERSGDDAKLADTLAQCIRTHLTPAQIVYAEQVLALRKQHVQ